MVSINSVEIVLVQLKSHSDMYVILSHWFICIWDRWIMYGATKAHYALASLQYWGRLKEILQAGQSNLGIPTLSVTRDASQSTVRSATPTSQVKWNSHPRS
jgi:hypothetical protein